MLDYAPDCLIEHVCERQSWAATWDPTDLPNARQLLEMLSASRASANSNACVMQVSAEPTTPRFHPERMSGFCASS